MNRFRIRMLILALLIAGALPLSASIGVDRIATTTSAQGNGGDELFGDVWARTELFFGRSKPDGTVVTDEDFDSFLKFVVTPRFPDGLTVLFGIGQFRGSSGVTIREDSVVLILLYPLDDTGASDRIEEIRAAYKDAFQQESVLRVESRAGVSF